MNEPKWKDTFYYTQSERRGIFVFSFLLVLLLLLNSLTTHFYTPSKTDFTAFKEAIKEFKKEQKVDLPKRKRFPFNPNIASKKDLVELGLDPTIAQRIINFRQKGGRFYKKRDLQKIYGLTKENYRDLESFITLPKPKLLSKKLPSRRLQPHTFNPNTVTKKELISMGVAVKAVNQWMNYRSKGGFFKQKKDVGKIYALSPSQFQQLESYIEIPVFKSSTKSLVNKKYTAKASIYEVVDKIKIDVNTASIQEWQQLKGIGPAYAKRITNYRKKLGGFASINQIRATYGLPDSLFQKIRPGLFLSPIQPTIAINTATIDLLFAHPYIQKRQAKAIVNYRKNHGIFKKWKDIQRVKVFSEQELERLKPYIDFKSP